MRSCLLLVAAGAFAAAGCGGVAVHPVKGKVTLDGQPMKGGGAISFVPTGGQAGKAAGGEIKEDGTFVLTTNKDGDGSMAGTFRVVIHQSTEREPGQTKDGERAGKATSVVAPVDRIPAIYSDPMNSPATATVEAKANEINLDLKRNAGGAPQKGAMLPGDPLRGALALRPTAKPD